MEDKNFNFRNYGIKITDIVFEIIDYTLPE